HIGRQEILTMLVLVGEHGTGADRRMTGEYCRHFVWLNPYSANLDLIIEAPENLEQAVGTIASAVSSVIEQISVIITAGVLDESLLVFFRGIKVTEAAERSAQHDLAWFTYTTQLVIVSED